jgi:hypothetical protein
MDRKVREASRKETEEITRMERARKLLEQQPDPNPASYTGGSMADRILPFHPQEQNLLKFPTAPQDRKKIELHRLVDELLDAGLEDFVSGHLVTWGNYYLGKQRPTVPEVKPQPEEEPEKPLELTPEELEIKANPLRFLPKVSGLIAPDLYRKFVNILWSLDPKHAKSSHCQSGRIGRLRLRHGKPEIQVTDLDSGIYRFYVCSGLNDGHRTPEHCLSFSANSASYRLVNRLVAGRIAPEYLPEAIEELTTELTYVSKIGEKYIRPHMRGEERIAVTRFREWMAKHGATVSAK